ncbi:MAG TPA: hypothetical protein PK308_02245 [Phycisphaerales bacterium]|nr:hypothetical protein [Phycisphaerales bacterium]
MAIDPNLYEQVTGRSPDEAQRRLGEALASDTRRKARNEEIKSRTRVPGWIGGLGILDLSWVRTVGETGGWWGIAFMIGMLAAIVVWLIL